MRIHARKPCAATIAPGAYHNTIVDPGGLPVWAYNWECGVQKLVVNVRACALATPCALAHSTSTHFCALCECCAAALALLLADFKMSARPPVTRAIAACRYW